MFKIVSIALAVAVAVIYSGALIETLDTVRATLDLAALSVN